LNKLRQQIFFENYVNLFPGRDDTIVKGGAHGEMDDAFLARAVLGLLCNPAESTQKASSIPRRASCGRCGNLLESARRALMKLKMLRNPRIYSKAI